MKNTKWTSRRLERIYIRLPVRVWMGERWWTGVTAPNWSQKYNCPQQGHGSSAVQQIKPASSQPQCDANPQQGSKSTIRLAGFAPLALFRFQHNALNWETETEVACYSTFLKSTIWKMYPLPLLPITMIGLNLAQKIEPVHGRCQLHISVPRAFR